MTHALIIADIEGIAGVYDLRDKEKNSRLYTQEIEVCVKSLLEGGIDKITICDAHDAGNLIDPKITRHGNVKLVSQVDGLLFNPKYDFAILAGFHGMSGSRGILPHTIRDNFKEVAVIEPRTGTVIPIGEVELYTRWLGSNGVPVILVTGDRESVYEANCFNPYRQTCCIKSYHQKNAYDLDVLQRKLVLSVESALQLDKELCISQDNNEIIIEFYNPDVTEALAAEGYNIKQGKVLFANCAELVKGLYPLIDRLIQLDSEIWTVNRAFLLEVRTLAQHLKKEDLYESEIGHLLNKNLLQLDTTSREKILAKIHGLIETQ